MASCGKVLPIADGYWHGGFIIRVTASRAIEAES